MIGFSGALLVIRPGLEHFDWNSLYALATGFCFSGYVLLGRRLAGEGSPLQALVMTGLVGTLMMSFFQPAVWITPQGIEWVWMGAMGSIGLIGHYFIIKALEHAPASRLAPLGYFEIIGSVLVGLIAFGDLPPMALTCPVSQTHCVRFFSHWGKPRNPKHKIRFRIFEGVFPLSPICPPEGFF
ncbi:MAG: hypothetical protein CM15mP66_03360 [Pseudomonadota bacterium]|nr:MAG: hypothetical protein CM15mP66_03360 [Pseudomonadota bacterium]